MCTVNGYENLSANILWGQRGTSLLEPAGVTDGCEPANVGATTESSHSSLRAISLISNYTDFYDGNNYHNDDPVESQK